MAPSAVSFGPIAGSTTAEETVTIRNVSVRPVRVRLQVQAPGAVSVTATPRFLRVPAGESADVTLSARALGTGARGIVVGSVSVIPATGIPQRALWSLTLGEAGPPLLANVELQVGGAVQDEEEKSQHAVVRALGRRAHDPLLQAGRVVDDGGRLELQPVSRLDIRLRTVSGDDLGLLARLRDLLPGRYAFGLTGRGPGGNVLPQGVYTLRLVAVPTDDSRPTRRSVTFRIE